MFLTGKVAVSDGTPLTESVVIQSICNGMLRNEGRTDFKGNFSFEVNGGNNFSEVQADADVSGAGFGNQMGRPDKKRDLSRCELQAVLPGFISQTLNLAIGANFASELVLHVATPNVHFTCSRRGAPDGA